MLLGSQVLTRQEEEECQADLLQSSQQQGAALGSSKDIAWRQRLRQELAIQRHLAARQSPGKDAQSPGKDAQSPGKDAESNNQVCMKSLLPPSKACCSESMLPGLDNKWTRGADNQRGHYSTDEEPE